jgi:hypothetical protein
MVVRRTVIKANIPDRQIHDDKPHVQQRNKKHTKKCFAKDEIDDIFGF